MRQGLAIVGLCIAAAVAYGLVHDQVTVRLSLEYFTVLHPHVVDTDSPTVLALVWGVIASWWMGAALGVPLAVCCRSGPGARLGARDLVRPVLLVLALMGAGAVVAGAAGWWLAAGGRVPANYPGVPPEHQVGTMAVAFAHVAAESLGVTGGLFLCLWAVVRRMRLDAPATSRD